MTLGTLLMILVKLDNRIKDIDKEQLVIGTLDQILCDNQVSVLLENGDIWVGDKKFIKEV